MKTITLYSTLGCHLCEDAISIVRPLARRFGFELLEVDVSESEQLMSTFGLVIPVLENSDGSKRLRWPFDAAAVQLFLEQL